jgi:hypothetical protein
VDCFVDSAGAVADWKYCSVGHLADYVAGYESELLLLICTAVLIFLVDCVIQLYP